VFTTGKPESEQNCTTFILAMNSNLKRGWHHLSRSVTRRTIHAVGGILVLLVQFLEWCMALLRTEFSSGASTSSTFPLRRSFDYVLLFVTVPFALGLATPSLRKRQKYSRRKWSAYTGMSWVCAFHTLACSSYSQRHFNFDSTSFTTIPTAQDDDHFIKTCTLLFYVFLGTSLLLTVAEVV
jgi:hypothetical protein